MASMLQNLKRYDWDTWIMGIFRAFVAGGAGAITSPIAPMIQDPKVFNLADGYGKVIWVMVVGFLSAAFVGMGIFLKTHPGPDPDAEPPAFPLIPPAKP